MSGLLYACTKCHSRHPFEELTSDSQLCKGCNSQGSTKTILKCRYCRNEFQPEGKFSTTSPTCKKCAHNYRMYGKPSECEYCHLLAAFVGGKCVRCSHYEKKYGRPLACEQCKQKCAFNKKEDRFKPGKKILCYLCAVTYSKVMAKAKHAAKTGKSIEAVMREDAARRARHKKMRSEDRHKRKNDLELSLSQVGRSVGTASSASKANGDKSKLSASESRKRSQPFPSLSPGNKKSKLDEKPATTSSSLLSTPFADPSSSHHVIVVTNLKEEIGALKKQLAQKENLIFEKDKKIAELGAKVITLENRLRSQVMDIEKKFQNQLNDQYRRNVDLQSKNSDLGKQVAGLKARVSRVTSFSKKPSMSSMLQTVGGVPSPSQAMAAALSSQDLMASSTDQEVVGAEASSTTPSSSAGAKEGEDKPVDENPADEGEGGDGEEGGDGAVKFTIGSDPSSPAATSQGPATPGPASAGAPGDLGTLDGEDDELDAAEVERRYEEAKKRKEKQESMDEEKQENDEEEKKKNDDEETQESDDEKPENEQKNQRPGSSSSDEGPPPGSSTRRRVRRQSSSSSSSSSASSPPPPASANNNNSPPSSPKSPESPGDLTIDTSARPGEGVSDSDSSSSP